MARLGELLVSSNLCTAEQVEQALRAQVVWGGRLGTNLVELKAITLDDLSKALGRQHLLPAALARVFDHADPDLQQRFPADLASALAVVPLIYIGTGGERKITLASIDPLDVQSHAVIADVFGIKPDQLIVSIAAELRVRYHLERVYGIPRPARFLRARGPSSPDFPRFTDLDEPADTDPDAQIPPPAVPSPVPVPVTREPTPQQPDADDLSHQIDAAVAAVTSEADPADSDAIGRERRRYVATLGDAQPQPPPPSDAITPPTSERVLGRMPLRKVAHSGKTPVSIPIVPIIEDRGLGETLDDATRAIRRSTNRDRVAELVVAAIEKFVPDCDAAIMLVVRGTTAIGWKWFCRSGQAPPEIAVPLDQDGLIPRVIRHNSTARCDADDLEAIDLLLLRALGKTDGDLVVVPVSIGDRVMCLVVTATKQDSPVGAVEAVAVAAGTGFARLIRDASR